MNEWGINDDDLFNIPSPHLKHRDLLDKMEKIREEFNKSSWNSQPTPDETDLLVISSGISRRYSEEAIHLLNAKTSVLNLTTTYPLPLKIVFDNLKNAKRVLFAEEIDPFVEDEVRTIAIDLDRIPEFHGKRDHSVPAYGEMTTDIMEEVIAQVLNLKLEPRKKIESDILIPVLAVLIVIFTGQLERYGSDLAAD